MIKPTSDQAAIVDTSLRWIAIADRQPPRGSKLLLINEAHGVCTLGTWSPQGSWTHWFPLPVFAERL